MIKILFTNLLFFFCCLVNANWSPPFQIDQSEEDLSGDIAFDGQGNAICAWKRGTDPLVSYYDVSLDMWNDPASLSEEFVASAPTLTVNDQGYAVVVWSAKDFVRASLFNPDSKTWSKAIIISKKGNFLRPSLSIDGYGNVIVAWNNRLARKIRSVSYDSFTGYWSSPMTLAEDISKGYFFNESCTYAHAPVVQLTHEGVGMAAWVVIKGDSCVVQGSFYDANSKRWVSPIDLTWKFDSDVIDGKKTGAFFDLCVNEHGIATVVWEQPGYIYPLIKYVEYDVHKQKRQSWAYSQTAAVGICPEIFTNEEGQAALSFAYKFKHVLIPFETGEKVELEDLAVFGDAVTLETCTGIDQQGNILTAWCDYDKETMKQYVARYDAGLKRWEKPICLTKCPFEVLGRPALDVQEGGQAVLSWSTYDPEKEVNLLNVPFYTP